MAVRKYELMLILDPSQSEEQQNESLKLVEDVVVRYGGTIDRREIWGKRRLAYTIRKRRDGYYALIYFDAESEGKVLAEVELFCRVREEILRHLLITAVVGKSKGDPSLLRQQEYSPRPGGYGGRGRRDDYAPRGEAAPPAPAPAAEAPAPEATE